MGVMKTSRRASTLDETVNVGKPLPTPLMLTGSALKKNAKFLQNVVTTFYQSFLHPKNKARFKLLAAA